MRDQDANVKKSGLFESGKLFRFLQLISAPQSYVFVFANPFLRKLAKRLVTYGTYDS